MARDPDIVVRQALAAVSLGDGVDELATRIRIGGHTARGRSTLRRYLERHRAYYLYLWAQDNDRRLMKSNLAYSERAALARTAITLDGRPARITDPTARRATITNGTHDIDVAWLTVKRVIKRGGDFTTTHSYHPENS